MAALNIENIFTMDSFKNYFFAFLYWLFIYFQPTYEFIMLVGFLVSIDTITGMYASAKEGIPITSKRFREMFPKFIVYGAAVLTAHVIEQKFFPDFPAMKIISGFIAYSELMSIDENIQRVTGVSLFKVLIKKLKK